MAHNEEPAVLLLDLRLEAGYTFAPFGGKEGGGGGKGDWVKMLTFFGRDFTINKATRSPEISREQVQKLTPQFLLYIYWI